MKKYSTLKNMNDALHYSIIVEELQILKTGRIEKILMPNNTDIIITIRANNYSHNLMVSTNPTYSRLHLTSTKPVNTKVISSFCTHLRKYLIGGIIKKIYCIKNERVINLECDCTDELGMSNTYTLVAELMGRRSNVLLLDNQTITDCLHKASIDITNRPTLANMPYRLPTSKIDYIEKLIKLTEIAQKTKKTSCIVFDNNNNPLDFCFCNNIETFCNININDYTLKYYDSLNNAINNFYILKFAETKLHNERTKIASTLKQLIKKIEKTKHFLSDQIENSQNLEQDKLYGELITAYIYKLKYGDKELSCLNYYDNTTLIIPLDDKKSPSQNAQSYYIKYNKKLRTLNISQSKLQEINSKLDYYNNILYLINNATTLEVLASLSEELSTVGILTNNSKKRQQQKTSEPRKLTIDGFNVLIGKNNIQNDSLVKSAHSTDIWLHASQIHSCHCIIKPIDRKKQIPLETITKVASVVAYYSHAKSTDKVPIDYCPIKNVSKPKGSLPGKVIYVNQKTLWVSPKLIE